MMPASSDHRRALDTALLPLATFAETHAGEIVARAERAWESSILLFAQISPAQQATIRRLAVETVRLWAIRLRQDPTYTRRIQELGQQWGEQAATWQLHVYSFTKALELLGHALLDYLAEAYPTERLTPGTVFLLARSRDQVLDDVRVPLMTTYLRQREVELEETGFSLLSTLSVPGHSLLLELRNRLLANRDRVVPAWIASVERSAGATTGMRALLEQRGGALVDLLLSLLESPTPETGAASISSVQAIGLESAEAGLSFQEMFHALQELRPILWDLVYEIYRREQYWHPAEFIEVLARLHLLLDLFSEGIGQAYLRQKEMIIQRQAEEIHQRDLHLAREILQGLLPSRTVQLPHSDLGAAWMPAREIGGDFYDIVPIDDDVLLIIGDVSGKGIAAALLVSMIKYVIKANAPWYRSPARLLSVANTIFAADMNPEMFVTMFVARYTPATGALLYSSGGHDPCYLCRDAEPARALALESQGPVLGVFPDIAIRDRRLWMQPNDVLVLYTDGLVNVRCAGHHRMESRWICREVQHRRQGSAQEIVEHLVTYASEGCEPTDDITVLVMKRKGDDDD